MQSCEIDLQVGGAWRYVMEAGEGGFEVAFHGEYQEIVDGERLVNTEVFEGAPPEAGAALDTNIVRGARRRPDPARRCSRPWARRRSAT